MTTPPAPTELRQLIDTLRPATVLKQLDGETPPLLCVYKAEALLELDRHQEAHDLLNPVIPQLQGDDQANAKRFKAYALVRMGQIDASILAAQDAARVAQSDLARADALASVAIDLATKHCWGLATSTLREAIELAPNRPRVLTAQAHLRLEADQRLEARAIYERLATLDSMWARAYADWGLSHVAYLLGEFEQSKALAKSALNYSDEIIWPFYPLIYLAFTQEDAAALKTALDNFERRSPQAASLPAFKEQLTRLQKRLATDPAKHRRLKAFPTAVQRRDHCGPCTVELVLRYWKGGLDLTNDQIAASIKLPQRGSPIYRMREFFHLVGFDTVHCFAPADKLKQLIDAGYPAIVEEEFPANAHVAVAIGYDDTTGEIELQDPATHAVIPVPLDPLNQIRRTRYNAVVVAFPANQDHAQALARMEVFDEPALVLSDQAQLAIDENHLREAAESLARAVQKQPALIFTWGIWLQTEFMQWQNAQHALPVQPDGLGARIKRPEAEDAAAQREKFYAVLARAKATHPDAKLVHQYEGLGALADRDIQHALACYQRAREIDPDDPRTLAALAECHYSLQEVDKALEMAQEALKRAPWLTEANIWAARCLACQGQDQAASTHYARCAVELAPNWWLAHQAMAEVHFAAADYGSARREAELALSLWPDTPEPRVLRGILISIMGDPAAAASEIELAIKGTLPLTPIAAHQAYQGLCRILFSQRMFKEAIEQIQQLLALMPQDPWALQFLAAAYCEEAIQSNHTGELGIIQEARRLYERAIAANDGKSWIVRDCAQYIRALADAKVAANAALTARETYPGNGNLIFVHGMFMANAGLAEPAARAMLQALARPDGIHNPQELYDAVSIILKGLGLAAGEQALLEASVPQGGAPLQDRQRALGLLLALYPEQAQRARELLSQALQADPNDAFVVLRLGDIAPNEAERESLYRRALRLAPRWARARATLAHYLADHARSQEALEFTTGHEAESFEMLTAHARSLYGTGHLEEAVAVCERAMGQSAAPMSGLYYLKWQAENANGQHQAALATAQKAMQLFPAEAQWLVRAAIPLIYLEHYDQAKKLIEQSKLTLKAEGLEAQYQLAQAKQDYDVALSIAEDLLKQQVEPSKPHLLTIAESNKLCVLAELGRTEEIRTLINAKSLKAAGWGHAAWVMSQAEQSDLALEFAEKALALDANHFAGLYIRAQALYDLDRAGEAWAAFEKLRLAFPNEHHAYEKFALRQALEGDLAEAWSLAERAVEFGPACPFAWATRGLVNLMRGQPADAEADLQIAWNRADITQRRKSCEFWWLLAELQGKQELAQERKRKAIDKANTSLGKRVIAQIEALLSARS